MSWSGVRAGVWLAGGWEVRLGVSVSLGPCCGGLGVPLGLVGRVGRSRDGPWGCPPWGPVPWSRVLWGFGSLVLGAAAVPSSSSGAREVALVVPGSSPGGEGVVVRVRRRSLRLPLWLWPVLPV